MMPLYEYQCECCLDKREEFRPVDHRDDPLLCECKGSFIRMLSVPTMHVWNQSRPFYNLTQHGDGTMKFRTKEDYHVHLKENHVQEAGLDAPKINKLGHKKVMSFS